MKKIIIYLMLFVSLFFLAGCATGEAPKRGSSTTWNQPVPAEVTEVLSIGQGTTLSDGSVIKYVYAGIEGVKVILNTEVTEPFQLGQVVTVASCHKIQLIYLDPNTLNAKFRIY